METFGDFIGKVTRRGEKSVRHHKASGSWGVYDAYKHIRRQGWYDIGRPLKEREFYAVVGKMNLLMAEEIAKGNAVTFPCRMGAVETRRVERKAVIRDGCLRVGYPVDWEATLRWWYLDREAMAGKKLLRRHEKTGYRLYYRKFPASYKGRSFYEFRPNRALLKTLFTNIEEGKADTLW